MENNYYHNYTQRNRGILDTDSQQKLYKAKVAIAGCGADGGAPAVSLARIGIRKFQLADPDYFDTSNINRQEGAFVDTVGNNKAETIEKLIRKVNPEVEVSIYKEGIQEVNVYNFLEDASILLEEVDYRKPQISILLHRTARELNIPILTAVSVGWNAFLFHFDPKGVTYEEYAGINSSNPITDLISKDVNISAFAPEIPSYLPKELIDDVLNERIEIPAVDPGVRLASSLLSAFTVFLLTGIKNIKPVPYYYSTGDLLMKEPSLNS